MERRLAFKRIAIVAAAAVLGMLVNRWAYPPQRTPGFNVLQLVPVEAVEQPVQPAAGAMPVAATAVAVPVSREEHGEKIPKKVAKIIDRSDWARVQVALNTAKGGTQAEAVQWFNGKNLHRGEVMLSSAEPDKKGCREFTVTRLPESKKESPKTATVNVCGDGTMK